MNKILPGKTARGARARRLSRAQGHSQRFQSKPMPHEDCCQRSLVAIIADDETLSGFALTGIPLSRDAPNFISVSKETTEEELEKHVEQLASRSDIAVVFVADFVYSRARDSIQKHGQGLPCFLRIPSKLGPR